MLTVAVPKRNKLPNIIVLTPKDGTQKNLERSVEMVQKKTDVSLSEFEYVGN